MRIFAALVASSTLLSISSALPFYGVERRHVAPRAKSYSVINVDGGSTTTPPQTVVETITHPAPITTQTLKITNVSPSAVVVTLTSTHTKEGTPSPRSTPTTPITSSQTTSSSLQKTSSSSSEPSRLISTSPLNVSTSPTAPLPASTMSPSGVQPSVVTIIVTASPAVSTEYYDDGMWHTRYTVKTFGTVAANSTTSSSFAASTGSPGPLPASVSHSYNGTQNLVRHGARQL
ncbi:hypothetical protein GQ43DRAFT_439769 [Delitschia confertaspora ATCC 74209]|uniref:Uncharacterized protein n=1 Tax=Delitschia confertaspora ATCC 74209 TaxID=1513339 RepID=A0A9P4MTC0_9PLEO|nr:hypothetical protein GQ43DRAFT_439769 [Delitschia confertaspora ATCC 74209]